MLYLQEQKKMVLNKLWYIPEIEYCIFFITMEICIKYISLNCKNHVAQQYPFFW